jgi:hypothetical protein
MFIVLSTKQWMLGGFLSHPQMPHYSPILPSVFVNGAPRVLISKTKEQPIAKAGGDTFEILYSCLMVRYRWEGRYVLDTRATPRIPTTPSWKNTSPTYYPRIQGWDLWWLELLVVGLVLFRDGAAGILGVALVWGLEPPLLSPVTSFAN